LLIAFLLVIIIIYLFFRSWLIAFRPLIDIPVSLIGAFFIMYIMGFTINILSLLAIVLATGLVVDDGIVVTENIFKKIEQGIDKHKAAKEGSEEIYFAVISTSITLAVVFPAYHFSPGFYRPIVPRIRYSGCRCSFDLCVCFAFTHPGTQRADDQKSP
jgi:multidrug efflux pump